MVDDPWDYPWTTGDPVDGFVPDESRRPVVAVGSNASPAVLAGKLGTPVPVAPATVTGLAVGHSAHVSLRGFIAAAPFHDPGAVTTVGLSLLDAAQLALVDSTELNYIRRSLALPLDLGAGLTLPDFDVYVSRWGVLAEPEQPPLLRTTQRELCDLLRRRCVPFARLAGVGDVAEVMARFAGDESLRVAAREAFRASGWARPGGLEPGQ